MLTDVKGEIDRNTVLVGDFNTPSTSMDRASRQKNQKGHIGLKCQLDQMNLIDIYRLIHRKAKEYTFLSSNAHATFLRLDHVRPQNKSQ